MSLKISKIFDILILMFDLLLIHIIKDNIFIFKTKTEKRIYLIILIS